MPAKTRPPLGNRNTVCLQGFSNSESEKAYRLRWPLAPAVCALYDSGRQCGGCAWYAKFDADWGMCHGRDSPHFTETVFEHFSCAAQDEEGWDAHSFADAEVRQFWRDFEGPGAEVRVPSRRRRSKPA